MSSKVSVVIPCFNGEKYLGDAIKSILNQSHKADEIIVVDDGSTDSTKEIAASFEEVTYLFHKNHGVSFSRNRGLKECTGKYVIFLDADDLLPENRIKEDFELLEGEAEIGYVFGFFDVIDEKGNAKESIRPDSIVDAGYHTVLLGNATVSPGAVTFRTDTLRQLSGGFNVDIHAAEDFDLYLRFSRLFPIYCHNRVSLYYRRHQNNCSSFNGGVNTLTNMLRRLDEQKTHVSGNRNLERALKTGKSHWKSLLGPMCVGELISSLKAGEWRKSANILLFLLRSCPFILIKSISRRVVKRGVALFHKK